MSELTDEDRQLLEWLRQGPRPGTPRPEMEYQALVDLLSPLQNPAKVTEWEFQRIVKELARAYGWRVKDQPPGKTVRGRWVTSGESGFPDLVLVKPRHRVVFLELKKVGGAANQRQVSWIADLQSVGGTVEAYVVRPTQIRRLVKLLAQNPE